MAAAARKEIARDCQTWVFVFMHIHTRLDARIHSNGAEYLGIFFIVFHGTTCLQVAFTAVETGQLSCSPSPEREAVLRQEVSCQSSLATVW